MFFMNVPKSLIEKIYNEDKKIIVENVKKEIEEVENEFFEILKKLNEGKYLTSNREGVLIELEEKSIYVYIHDPKSSDNLVGRGLSRNILAYECEGIIPQENYKKILSDFKKQEYIGKVDLIELGSLNLIIWIHERYGHIKLDRELGTQKWFSQILYLVKMLVLNNMMENTFKLAEYLYDLSLYEELYSLLGELLYLFYKVYTGTLQPKEALQYLERYNPSHHIFNPTRYFSTKKLQESEIGKIIYEFSKNPDNITSEYLENIIALIARKRKEIEDRLKYWFENEVYKELVKTKEELRRESCKSEVQDKSSECL